MADTIGILSMFAVAVFVILAIISLFKRTKKVKKFLIAAGVCFVIMIIAAVNAPQKEKPLTTTATEKPTQNAQIEQSTNSTSVTGTSNQTATATPQKEEAKPVTDSSKKLINAKVTNVVDGDTMDVSFVEGDKTKNEKIRLLLVDTPETVDPQKPVQPFGTEASTFAKDTLNGKDVQIEIDVSERDKYGRLLCYLYVGDKMFNELLLEKGLARVAYVYPPNVKYIDQFRESQKKAQQSGVGIWSVENYAQEDGFHEEVVAKKEISASAQTVTPTQEPIKAPEPKVVEKPKPTPTPKQETQSNVYYKNCTAVREAGKAPLHRGDPGYSSKLDRDNDGIACE